MHKLTALTALRDKVQAGDGLSIDDAGNVFDDARQILMAVNAYIGSLDAAKSLHDAVLPGWTRDVDATAPECGIDVTVWRPMPCGPNGNYTEVNDCEARAWLIAILSALISEAQP